MTVKTDEELPARTDDSVIIPLRNINLTPEIEFLQSPETENPPEVRNLSKINGINERTEAIDM